MKVLLIGMDGVSVETFQRGWTPFVSELIKKGESLKLHEDLLSRGWSEIVTGQHAIVTGALYERPLMEKKYGWTESYKLNDVPGLGNDVKPIWQVLNEKGWRVGIMNVPTTYPAPEVDGFFVSGGGGGGPVDQRVSPEQCYPRKIQPQLEKQDYIVDERFGSLLGEKKLYNPQTFFSRLKEMNVKRTMAFKNLAIKEDVDFGFVVYKSSTVATESLIIPELSKKDKGLKYSAEILKEAEAFYNELDRHIKELIDTFLDAKVFLVSDHSTVLQRSSVNLNSFLVEQGFQIQSVARRGIYDVIKKFKHLVPHSVRSRLKKNNKIRRSYESIVTFDTEKSLAFCMAFSNGAHGIYINDNLRFSGPVEYRDIKKIAESIVVKFNEHPLALQYGFKANYKGDAGRQGKYLQFPDVVVDMPDGFQTSNKYKDFVRIIELPDLPLTLVDAERELRFSGKGHTPLAISVNGGWDVGSDSDLLNLTAIYNQIEKIASSK